VKAQWVTSLMMKQKIWNSNIRLRSLTFVTYFMLWEKRLLYLAFLAYSYLNFDSCKAVQQLIKPLEHCFSVRLIKFLKTNPSKHRLWHSLCKLSKHHLNSLLLLYIILKLGLIFD
jgi:hypothetical protein